LLNFEELSILRCGFARPEACMSDFVGDAVLVRGSEIALSACRRDHEIVMVAYESACHTGVIYIYARVPWWCYFLNQTVQVPEQQNHQNQQ
jgi:hypothetical protein